MQPSRVLGAAAVCASAVRAGTIDSSSGSASETPVPFEERPPREMPLRDERHGCVPPTFFFIWNGVLCTIPPTSAENR